MLDRLRNPHPTCLFTSCLPTRMSKVQYANAAVKVQLTPPSTPVLDPQMWARSPLCWDLHQLQLYCTSFGKCRWCRFLHVNAHLHDMYIKYSGVTVTAATSYFMMLLTLKLAVAC